MTADLKTTSTVLVPCIVLVDVLFHAPPTRVWIDRIVPQTLDISTACRYVFIVNSYVVALDLSVTITVHTVTRHKHTVEVNTRSINANPVSVVLSELLSEGHTYILKDCINRLTRNSGAREHRTTFPVNE